uniref:Uncharacterized protein n=1 Tax=Sander lucioperca TaxID=283035 RepID=A0A8C9ZZH5_SANLU
REAAILADEYVLTHKSVFGSNGDVRRQQPGAVTKIRCQVGQFPADSSSLQAEQEVTETLWSDSDLIKFYQTHTQSPVLRGRRFPACPGSAWVLQSVKSNCAACVSELRPP